MVQPGEIFKMKVLRRLVNAILILVFADTILHRRAWSLIFQAELIESVLSILSYPDSTIRRTIFKIKVLRRLENTILRLIFEKLVVRKAVMLPY